MGAKTCSMFCRGCPACKPGEVFTEAAERDTGCTILCPGCNRCRSRRKARKR